MKPSVSQGGDRNFTRYQQHKVVGKRIDNGPNSEVGFLQIVTAIQRKR
jgi:hypothetical protein